MLPTVYIFSVSFFLFILSLWSHKLNCTHSQIGFNEKASSHLKYLWNISVIHCILTRCSMAGWIILASSSMTRYTRSTLLSTVACVTNASPSNWRLGIDVSKYRQNGLVWNAQSHKCQFSIQQCLPNTHTFPQQCVQKRTCMFSYTGRKIAWLASWHTKSPTSHTKISLWSGNYRSSHLIPSLSLFLPVFLIFWLQIEGDRLYKNPSIWLLTEKKLKMYSVPSALWLTNNVGWLRNCIDNRAGWYRVCLTDAD